MPPQRHVDLVAEPASPVWIGLGIAGVIALAFVSYLPCLNGEFIFDDNSAVVGNRLVRNIWPLERFLLWSNRPLVHFSLALDYAQGGLDPWWYRVTNVGLHAATAAALYGLALRTLRLPQFESRYARSSQAIAWVAAALFACHPLASGTVAYVASRSEGLVGLFYLLTLLAYSAAITAKSRRRRNFARWTLPLTTACALASKEVAVTIPIALVLYDYAFIARGDVRSTFGRKNVIGLSLLPFILGAAYFVYRESLAGEVDIPNEQSAGFGLDRFTTIEYLGTQFGVLVHYARLMFVPVGLNMDYDWPMPAAPYELAVVVPALLLVAAAWLAVRVRATQPFLFFFVFFFLLVLAPTSSVMPLADLAVERRAYIPLAGFCLAAAAVVWDVSVSLLAGRARVGLAIATALLLAPLILQVRARATQWGDHLLMYEDTVAKSPGSPRVRLNLGAVLLGEGRYDEAYEVLVEARRLYDAGQSVHATPTTGAYISYNLGVIELFRENYEAAFRHMQDTIEVGGHYASLRPRALAAIGTIHRIRGDYAAAEIALEEAIEHSRENPAWVRVLAEVQLAQRDAEAARKTIIRLNLRHPELADSPESKQLLEDLRKLQRELRRESERAN